MGDLAGVRRSKSYGVGIAVIRTVVEPGPRPVIRILELADLSRDPQVLAVTTSVEEAAQVIQDWLKEVVARANGYAGHGPVTPT